MCTRFADATICIPGNHLQHRAVATSCNWVVQECTLSYLNAANKPKTRVVVCPALLLPGNSVPGWTISRESLETREIQAAVYINNWQQTPTFLTFCIQTQWERETYCKTSTRAMLQYPVPSTSTLYNPVCSTQAKLARNRDKLFLIKQSLLAHAFRSFQCSF